MQKKRKLEDIVVKEVSFVDLPAIRRRFLICKRGESKMTIIEIYKKLTGQDITEDKLTTEQKAALETLAMYDEAMPDDMAKAVGEFVKIPEPPEEKPEDLEKAGAKLSKDTITKLKGVAKAILELLPEDERDIAKADPEEERENRIADKVVEKLGLAKASENKPKDDKPQDDKPGDKGEDDKPPDSEVAKQLKAISDRLAVVEQAKGVKKGLEGDGPGESSDEDEWPSWKI
jgi:DNA-directed RNA polymerase subunit F